jgi:hypothetical protein
MLSISVSGISNLGGRPMYTRSTVQYLRNVVWVQGFCSAAKHAFGLVYPFCESLWVVYIVGRDYNVCKYRNMVSFVSAMIVLR